MLKNKFLLIAILFFSVPALAKDTPAPTKKKRLSLLDVLNSTKPTGKSATVAGVRGLDETSAGVDTNARDYAAVQRLEQVVVHDDEVQKFIDQGKLQ